MKKSLSVWQIFGFMFTGIAGVILHFLYDWTNQSIIVAPFSAVNESIWEHMKLLFFPMFSFALLENRSVGRYYNDFWCVKLIGIITGIVLIPVLYYTINGIFGETADWVNIAIFFVVAAATYFNEIWLLSNDCVNCNSQKKALLILWIMVFVFVICTFVPPRIPLFEDPVTGTYGYK